MRSWDNWNKYTDNDNKPLHGCIQFVVNVGNTSAPIYDKDGTPLNNPQLTDAYGRTQHQVFINEDVIAYYYKYIGNGEWYTEQDIDPSDVSKWQLQYTSKSELFFEIDNEAKSAYAVNCVEDLRDLIPDDVPSIDGVKIVTLMGYNEAGDKEPINYIWNSESMDSDDGGAVLATDQIKGRWIMVPPTEHLDVRHYGVFPSNSQNMVDQTLSVQSALIYANNHGLRLFFDTYTDIQTYKYYKLTNITLNPIQQIDLAKGVEFIDSDLTIHSSQTNAFNNDPHFLNGDTTLYSNYAKASWNIKSLSKSKIYEEATYIIDSNSSSTNVKTFQGWNVDVEQNITGYTFVQCNVYGSSLIASSSFTTCQLNMKGTIGDSCNFTNCKLNEFIFNNSPTVGTVTNCIVDIDDFTHKVNLWNSLNFMMATYKDIDFKNVAIPTDFAISNQELGDRTYSNFIGTGTSHTFGETSVAHTYRFNNVRGNIRIPGNANNTYVFDNCVINLTFGLTDKASQLIFRNSEVVLNSNLPNATIMVNSSTISLNASYSSVSVKDSTLFGLASSTRLNCSNFTAYSSIVNEEVSAPNILYKDSQINKDIYSINNGTSIVTYIDNCIWNDIQQHISSDTANTIISGAWTNNNATKANPIVFDMTNINGIDEAHNYTYSNNKGTFLPESVHLRFTQEGCYSINETTWYYHNGVTTTYPRLINVPCIVRQNARKSAGAGDTGWCYYCYGVWIPDTWDFGDSTFNAYRFFSIGYKPMRVDVKCTVPFDGPTEASVTLGTFKSYFTFEMEETLVHINGYSPAINTMIQWDHKLLHGPNYIPYSYNGPKDVPEAEPPVIPPTDADNYYFIFDIDITYQQAP